MRFRISNCTLIGLAVFAVVSWCIWGEGYFMSCALSPDGVSYLRMSEAAAHGHLFNPNGVSGHEGWFARWPLGYPWCIALVMKMTSLDAFTSARVLATLLAVPAFHFLSMERELRRVMHLPMESWHEGYHAVRAHVMEKYADVPSGTRFAFPNKYPGVYYWIDFLRPDILADVPDSPDKGF